MASKPTAKQQAVIARALATSRANKAAGRSAFGARDQTGNPYAKKATKAAARPKAAPAKKIKPDNGPGFDGPDHWVRDRKGRFA